MASSYDYSARQGVLPISWEDFHGLCKGLARAVAGCAPEIILAVGRGGFYPGTLIAHLLASFASTGSVLIPGRETIPDKVKTVNNQQSTVNA
ncbi:MAG: hypothetical protein K1X65_22535 [Caldilineales bacterium]|nr:hypothetical protein [Caldilineales bacterium]MCW5859992.1 hypothetical protein [Caldilineales bacterium]